MISGKQILWGTLGWAFGGPIGGILGVIFAGSNDQSTYKQVKQSQAGDFMVSLLVLFAQVMKADGKLLKSELDYVKNFLRRNLSRQQSHVFIKMLRSYTTCLFAWLSFAKMLPAANSGVKSCIQ